MSDAGLLMALRSDSARDKGDTERRLHNAVGEVIDTSVSSAARAADVAVMIDSIETGARALRKAVTDEAVADPAVLSASLPFAVANILENAIDCANALSPDPDWRGWLAAAIVRRTAVLGRRAKKDRAP